MAKHAPEFLALVDDAKTRIQECTVSDVREWLAAGDAFHLIDVREDREWQAGHLPGATHLGKGIIERDVEAEIPDRSAKLVLYCGGGYRSALAADNLQRMGYKQVISMDGGIRGWKDAALPIATDD